MPIVASPHRSSCFPPTLKRLLLNALKSLPQGRLGAKTIVESMAQAIGDAMELSDSNYLAGNYAK
jgi:hypothetical protein